MFRIFLIAAAFIQVYSSNSSLSTESFTPIDLGANGNIKFLWAIPLEEVRFFSPQDSQKALLPDWMRSDLNIVALELYKDFLARADVSSLDDRDAESLVSAFVAYQMEIFENGLFNATKLTQHLGGNLSAPVRDAIIGVDGFRRLLGKVATDFAEKMGFLGGSKYLYQAKIWAEVLAPGDAVLPKNFAASGAVAAGVLFTHIPQDTTGTPVIELLDPRGHNPPFGKDEVLNAKVGSGFLYPGWVDRMTLSHRCCQNDSSIPDTLLGDVGDILRTHRIDWGFEVGLFQYPDSVLRNFFDLENCPFQNGFRRLDGQLFFDLSVQELVKLEMPRPASLTFD
jgi:hypothetical protein